MKKSFLFVAALFLMVLSRAQTSPVDEIFNKYSEKEGFTVVTISSRMFSMFANQDAENKDADNIMRQLKSIKILSVGDSLLNKTLNFYTELNNKQFLEAYEELLVVKEGPDITKFLIKESGDLISELLVITGGPGGNSIISIKGDINLKNLSDLSKNIGIQELKGLDNINKKAP